MRLEGDRPLEALKPTGLWSYTSADDASSDGRLTQLRRLLANHLQGYVGRAPARTWTWRRSTTLGAGNVSIRLTDVSAYAAMGDFPAVDGFEQ
jgi:hypothetical protein